MAKLPRWRPKKDWIKEAQMIEFLKDYLRAWCTVSMAVDLHNDAMIINKTVEYCLNKQTVYSWLQKFPHLKVAIDSRYINLQHEAIKVIHDSITLDRDVWTATWLLEKINPEFKNKKEITINNIDEDTKAAQKAQEIIASLEEQRKKYK